MIDYIHLVEEMRRRIVNATGINPLTQLQTENHDIDPSGLPLWIAEWVIGGTEDLLTNDRSQISGFLVQYDIFVPANSGSSAGINAQTAIVNAFDLSDESKGFNIPELDVNIKSIKRESDGNNDWRRYVVLFTLDLVESRIS